MNGSEPQFDVFLCHNSSDKPAVKEIGRLLRREGINPWLDEWNLRPGLPFHRELEKQINNIGSAAVFVGENGIGPWQEMEIYGFLQKLVEQERSVIPVILHTAKATPKLPLFLSNNTWVDFRKSDPDPLKHLIFGIRGSTIFDQQQSNGNRQPATTQPSCGDGTGVSSLPTDSRRMEEEEPDKKSPPLDTQKSVRRPDSRPTRNSPLSSGIKRNIIISVVALFAGVIWMLTDWSQPKQEQSLGRTVTVGEIGLELIRLSPDKFDMGSGSGESGHESNEGPQASVAINREFWMGKYEVTRRQWSSLMKTETSNLALQVDDVPVTSITWDEAKSFCEEVNRRFAGGVGVPKGYEFRLPTEAEWEYACRAGSTNQFCFGDSKTRLQEHCWFGGKVSKAQPIGLKKPNDFGIHDMHGNVWEWREDGGGTYTGEESVDPIRYHAEDPEFRALRGGSWRVSANACRSAKRYGKPRSEKDDTFGFRIVIAAKVTP